MDASAPPPLRRRILVLLAGLLVTLALPATAEEATQDAAPAVTTIWTCWYNGKTRVLCRLARAQGEGDASLAEPYPGRDQLPDTVRTIRERPTALNGHTLVIPLFSRADDMRNTEDLADAVMCGARSTCRVDFFQDVAALAMIYEEDPAND